MSSTTILQLRQDEATDVSKNGSFKTLLDFPITIDEGDEVVIKSVFLDTTVEDEGIIAVNDNLTLTMSCMMYLQNYVTDQKAAFGTEDPAAPTTQLRTYGPTAVAVGDRAAPEETGDNNLWWLGQTYQSTNEIYWVVESISWEPTHPWNATHRVRKMDIHYEYTGVIPNKPQSVGQVHIPPMRASHFSDYNPRPVGITCTGTADAPNFIITTPDYDMEIRNINPASIKINAIKQTSTGSHQVVPQIFNFTFDLEAGNYTPQELGKAITNKVNNLEKNGNVYGETDSSQDKYPVNSPFLTTVVQNDFKIKAEGLAATPAYVTDQVFVSSTLGVFNPKLDGKLYFSYPVNNMVNNAQADPYRPEMDRFVGTNEIAIEFDDGEQKLKVTAQHFPIYNNLTEVATANDALPAVAYNITETAADFEVTTGLVTRYSGIAWTSLTAIDKKTKKPTSFWNDIGFTNMCVQPTSKGIRMDYGGVVPSEDNSFTVTATDGVNITGGYAGLDVPVVKNNITYTTPYANNTQISYVGTSITSSLFANRVFNSAPESEGYYLIEIGTNFKQEFIGGSATYMSGIQSIVNRYFTQNSFTSDQGAGSISYIHSGVSQTLTEFNIRVLNPNFMVPAETQLGPKNTIFIQVIKPKKINPTKP